MIQFADDREVPCPFDLADAVRVFGDNRDVIAFLAALRRHRASILGMPRHAVMGGSVLGLARSE